MLELKLSDKAVKELKEFESMANKMQDYYLGLIDSIAYEHQDYIVLECQKNLFSSLSIMKKMLYKNGMLTGKAKGE